MVNAYLYVWFSNQEIFSSHLPLPVLAFWRNVGDVGGRGDSRLLLVLI